MTQAALSSVVSEQSHGYDTRTKAGVTQVFFATLMVQYDFLTGFFFCIWILARWLTNSFNGRLSLRPRCAQGSLRSSAELTKVDFKRRVPRCKRSYTPAHDARYKTTQSGGTTNARAQSTWISEVIHPLKCSFIPVNQRLTEGPLGSTTCPIHREASQAWRSLSHNPQASHISTQRYMATQSQVLARRLWLRQGGHASGTGGCYSWLPWANDADTENQK